ncbi:MAG: flagellar basal body P-ring biosynthesis protein FlgA [Alphaproteobacteria bacterium ADurb.Bin438]|nr:MAG: flagellar basal body P-ring biosynthesis protein FlgA [Alphaproteobacteria bacterium ADurb.Bin438]
MKKILLALSFIFMTFNANALVYLKNEARVADKHIMLSDVFEGIKSDEDHKIASSPNPFETITLDASFLSQVAKGYGIDWAVKTGYETIKVTREGKFVATDTVLSLIKESLFDKGVSEEHEISLINSDPIAIPSNIEPSFEFSDIAYIEKTGLFSGTLLVKNKQEIVLMEKINAKVFEMIEIPVAKSSIPLGKVIEEEDLEYQRIKTNALRTNVALNIDEIVGKYARRTIKQGQMVLINDLRMPLLVSKGKAVRMIFKKRNMTLTSVGKALDSGTKNELIRVMNPNSKMVVQAVVTGNNTVVVNEI